MKKNDNNWYKIFTTFIVLFIEKMECFYEDKFFRRTKNNPNRFFSYLYVFGTKQIN